MSAFIQMPVCPEFGEYDQLADEMAVIVGEFAEAGLVNILGGCCGTTPEHIEAIAAAAAKERPRAIPEPARLMRLSGWSRLPKPMKFPSSMLVSAPMSPAQPNSVS